MVSMGFPGGSVVKDMTAKQEKQIWSLVQEDPLEEEMATYSRFLTWTIPWPESLVGYSPWSRRELDTTEWPTLTE